MTQKTIYICLISGQLLPNLIPLLMEKPEAVQLIVTKDMEAQAKRFKRILAQQKIRVIEPDQSCPDTGFDVILERASEFTTKLKEEYAKWDITLNATGGTKLMAFGFVEVFREELPDATIIYVDTEHTQVEFLDKTEFPPAPVEMRDVVKVQWYLAAYGFTVRSSASATEDWQKRANKRRPLTEHFANNSQRLSNFFGAINLLAREALDKNPEKLKKANQSFNQRDDEFLTWLTTIQEIAKSEYRLVKWNETKRQITFCNAEAARYLGGIWLEEYVWHIVKDAKPFDVQCSIKATWEEGDENEFDILATHRNRLLVIECKTSKFGRNANEDKDQDILYKLDALGTKAKGLFGATWLVSARPLTDAVRSRARSQKIEVIEAEQLADLRQKVLDWMKG